MTIEIKGAEQLAALSKALKQAGAVDLRSQLNKTIRDAMTPVRKTAKRNELEGVPPAAAKSISRHTKFRLNRRNGGIRLLVSGTSNARMLNNAGMFRHPVATRGKARDEWKWVNQGAESGWFDRAIEGEAPKIQREVERAMVDVAAKIGRRL